MITRVCHSWHLAVVGGLSGAVQQRLQKGQRFVREVEALRRVPQHVQLVAGEMTIGPKLLRTARHVALWPCPWPRSVRCGRRWRNASPGAAFERRSHGGLPEKLGVVQARRGALGRAHGAGIFGATGPGGLGLPDVRLTWLGADVPWLSCRV